MLPNNTLAFPFLRAAAQPTLPEYLNGITFQLT
jgi:hypothetical protein